MAMRTFMQLVGTAFLIVIVVENIEHIIIKSFHEYTEDIQISYIVFMMGCITIFQCILAIGFIFLMLL